MTTQVTLQHTEDARKAHDPQTVELLLEIIHANPDPSKPPVREGAYTFQHFLDEINRPAFYQQKSDEQAQQRIEKIKLVEANKEIEPRYKTHELIYDLWTSKDPFDRRCLLDLIARTPIVYGPWKALKKIFKEAEAIGDVEVFGALSARFDAAYSSGHHRVSNRTLGYLCRRSWRYLRKIAQTLPVCYADTAVEFLVAYKNEDALGNSWVFNQIFKHGSGDPSRRKFHFESHQPEHIIKTRGFPELWKRSPLPLFTILQSANNDIVLKYAALALQTDFRTVLREIEPKWVRQLINNNRVHVHNFVAWILKNVPKFEHSKLRELELHEPILQLLNSPSSSARNLAVQYARVHARDIPINRLIGLANSEDEKVRGLATDLLRSHDPRTDVGLDAWGQLLATQYGHKMAVEVLQKHFTSDDLTPDWFKDLLLSEERLSSNFAREHLLDVHPLKKLGAQYFYQIYDDADPTLHYYSITFALQKLAETDLNDVPIEWLEQILVRTHIVSQWVDQGLLNANRFDPEFLKAISFHPTFDQHPVVIAARKTKYLHQVTYNQSNAESIFRWLSDIRQFTPDQIGFEWLMKLVQRDEPHYHQFATDLMIKTYLPADFAASITEETESESDSDEINIDFEGATFVFTGKLATMTRSEAQKKVIAANGKNSGTVGKTLGYLVIGDEGSPMYGMGRKGSKQVKAESLNEAGAQIKIISETAFLQMLTGAKREFSDDAINDGCDELWKMVIENKEGSPISRFAIKYIRHHHPDICLADTDRPVDPGAEIPENFLIFKNIEPLLSDKRQSLRELGLELCQFEFARMAPSLSELLSLSQVPFQEVCQFVAESMTASPTPQNRRWRLDPDTFTAEEVYLFCQSRNAESRSLGMKLIEAHPRMRDPEKLFALSESPDRNIRALVIRSFWSLYRDRGIKNNWAPKNPPESEIKKKKLPPDQPRFGNGAPKVPESYPAANERMQFFLKKMLFEIPPGRPPMVKGSEIEELKIVPLPTRKAKIMLIETLRDIAINDHDFGGVVLPVLEEFAASHGMSEQAACLVALTRIKKSMKQEPLAITVGEQG
ncbi:MAG: BRCT domain-containing protein [Candidatus Thiodiazotropha sp.]